MQCLFVLLIADDRVDVTIAIHIIHAITHLDPSLTLLAFVTTVMGSSSPILTVHIFSGFLPLTLLSSIDRTIPTLYLDVSAIIDNVWFDGDESTILLIVSKAVGALLFCLLFQYDIEVYSDVSI